MWKFCSIAQSSHFCAKTYTMLANLIECPKNRILDTTVSIVNIWKCESTATKSNVAAFFFLFIAPLHQYPSVEIERKNKRISNENMFQNTKSLRYVDQHLVSSFAIVIFIMIPNIRVEPKKNQPKLFRTQHVYLTHIEQYKYTVKNVNIIWGKNMLDAIVLHILACVSLGHMFHISSFGFSFAFFSRLLSIILALMLLLLCLFLVLVMIVFNYLFTTT